MSEAGGRPAIVSSLEGEVGPGGISGVPSDRGDMSRLGGVGVGRIGGRMIAEWRRVKGKVEEWDVAGKIEGEEAEEGYEALGRRKEEGRAGDPVLLPGVGGAILG